MEITLDAPMDQVDEFVARVFRDQIPFAESVALNQTAKDFQKNERVRLADVFTLRRKTWAERSIKISPFATKQKREVRIAVDPPGGRGDILGKFETDTTKTPRGNSVAVPTEYVPRTASGVIRQGWRPSQLRRANGDDRARGKLYLTRTGRIKQATGGTFLVERGGGRGTIFRRKGGEIVPLYHLVPLVRIEPELEFHRTAEKTVQERWATNFVAAFDQAIRTAR